MSKKEQDALQKVSDAAAEALKVVSSAADRAKTVVELQTKIDFDDKLKKEREVSNSSYAPIIIKTIVYGFIGLICIAFVAFLTAKVWPQ
jgi:hypothetical protein